MIHLEDYSSEILLNAMLSRIPDTIDKREGSIIYDALAPAAYELALLYKTIGEAYDNSFISTATGAALDLRGAEMGIFRRHAVKALRKAKFFDAENAPFNVEIGASFSTLDGDKSESFIVFEKVEDGTFLLEAEKGGEQSNRYIGELLPLQYTPGLALGMMEGEPTVSGADEESDEDFRSRYLYKIQNEPANGNEAQYLQWALEYPGIGKAKIFPLWNGENTVKVSVLGADDMPCNAKLLNEFQEYLDPKSEGLGNGVAPIGAKVTASTVTLKNIDVSFSVTLDNGINFEQVNGLAKTAIKNYFNEISYKKSKVYYMEVGAAILSVEGIRSLSLLTLNNGIVDISLAEEERPHLQGYQMEDIS